MRVFLWATVFMGQDEGCNTLTKAGGLPFAAAGVPRRGRPVAAGVCAAGRRHTGCACRKIQDKG